MSEEKPLHVRVAEAIGWTDCHYDGERDGEPGSGIWFGNCSDCSVLPKWFCPITEGLVQVPSYDTDWSATGPLIEKYRIGLVPDGGRSHCWSAQVWWERFAAGKKGPDPLIAVCNLILALKEAGKLNG